MDPQRIPLVAPIGARYSSLSVDSRLVNCYAEQGLSQGEFFVYKRPGFVTQSAGAGAAAAHGAFTWLGDVYMVWGGTLYKNGGSLGAVDGTAAYGFTAMSGKGITRVMFLTNGVAAYTVSTTGTITDVTAAIVATIGSATWLPYCAFLDAYISILDTMGTIWTCTQGDPATWPALNYVSAWLEPDAPIALAKQLSYLVCVKEYYTQLFYDAGNATGSPLSAVPGAKINFGGRDGRTVVECGGDLIWVARTREGGVAVVLMSALKATPISTSREERLLQAADFSGAVYAWSAKVGGHRFYVVTVVNSNLTLVYDLTARLWYQWEDPSGNYLPYAFATIGAGNGVTLQHATSGATLGMDIAAYQDAGAIFTADIYTPNYRGGTQRQKTLTRLDMQGDRNGASTVRLYYSDDDYQTWTDAGTADLSTDEPFWADLGSFRRRAFRFSQSANAPMRVEAIEALVDVGAF